jgi:oligopeptide/dipeptide ABC transporter ATP-binding protein
MSLLAVEGLSKHYAGADGRRVQAVTDVSFALSAGETLGIVGESGCGKSTLAKAVLRLIEPSAGTVRFDGTALTGLSRRAMAQRRRDLGFIFQDPFGALNPRHTVGHIIAEPLIVHGLGDPAARAARVTELLDTVGLPADVAARYPHQFSGGQRQRIAIARALATGPRLVVADEPVSALDVSIQSQIINLIADLKRRFTLAMLFISHDLSVVRHVSDRVAVMYLGRIVETAPTEALFAHPRHPYTRALLSAVPRPGQRAEGRIVLRGELPDPAAPPPGCAFASRCPVVMDRCRSERPILTVRADGHTAACHLHALAEAPPA